MKARLFAAMTSVFFLCAVAAAQDYTIRVTFNTNLRATYSLEGDIVETAPARTTLHVVGQFGRWLTINRNGNELWMASWVSHTRVDNSGQTSSQTGTSSPIDNCCFVDRQCHSDQEWIDGYWAYQDNQCPTSTRSQTQTASQSTSSASAEVDNCCFIDRQCQTNQQWTDGYWAFQNNQCAAAPGLHTPVTNNGVIIEGTERFVARISAALDLLRSRAPQWHAYVTKGPLKIVEAYGSEADGYTHANSIYISPSAAKKPAHILAELLVHEACHVQRTLAGLFRYETEQQQNLEESLAGHVSSTMMQQINYGRMIMTYTPSQVTRLIRFGKLEQPTGTGRWLVTYITREVRQLLREGIDVFGAVRAEIQRAASLQR